MAEVVRHLEGGAPPTSADGQGSEMIAWGLREWCRLSGTRRTYVEPGSPWENPFAESVNGGLRDELLNLEEFADLGQAQVIVEDWRVEYNTYRPHSAQNGLTPDQYAKTPGSTNINQHCRNSWTYFSGTPHWFEEIRDRIWPG